MALPELIEIVPPRESPSAQITVPGSKSITNRALVLAALAEGETILEGALWSEDTQIMVDCLQELGYMVAVHPDPREPCNRQISVFGQGGHVPRGGTAAQPLELFVGNAGTAARFLTALVCLGQGVYHLHGVPRMHERPQAALLDALRSLGYRIDAEGNRLPALVHGGGRRPGHCTVSIQQSSQFASALLLGAGRGGWDVSVVGENAEESPYVAMTTQLIKRLADGVGRFQIEPDTSSGSYFWAARFLLQNEATAGSIEVLHWPSSGWQMDQAFPRFWPLPEAISREHHLGDSIMTAIVLAPWADHPVRFTELGRLRLQECERVVALRTELAKCGALVQETGDCLEVRPWPLHGAEIETYGDHRMAMCFAILGLKVPQIRIKNPACVKKTFPNFFQKLAQPPPHGLGAVIRDAQNGRILALKELAVDE